MTLDSMFPSVPEYSRLVEMVMIIIWKIDAYMLMNFIYTKNENISWHSKFKNNNNDTF